MTKALSFFFRRRTVWFPTLAGTVLILALLGAPVVAWLIVGEDWLCKTRPASPEVLVVESWVGIKGVHAAKEEFDRGGYRLLVTAGGFSNNRWELEHWNYAIEAGNILERLGVPPDKVLRAPAPVSGSDRTFENAIMVRKALEASGVRAANLNVFTLGTHARRSRLVFQKALGDTTRVGVISWIPPEHPPGRWWDSSERAVGFMKETVGWFYELLLNSGRRSNAMPADVK